MKTHTCPAPECERDVPDDMLACRSDWYRLPVDIRQAVWRDGFRGRAQAYRWYADNPR